MSLLNLPQPADRAEYELLGENDVPWDDVVRPILRRHSLPSAPIIRASDGSNPVFAVDSTYMLKLFPPFWSRLADAEAEVAAYIYGKLGIATPQVVATGMVDGWPYLISTRLHDVSLKDVWKDLPVLQQARIAGQLGEMLARLHALSVTELRALPSDWPSIIRQRVAGCVVRRRKQGTDENWLRQIPAWIEAAEPLYPELYRLPATGALAHRKRWCPPARTARKAVSLPANCSLHRAR